MKFSSTRTVLAFVVSMALGSSMAFAQATRTWVSGVGNDANPCSRTAPCKTFAGAISKTATGGEISVLDPGGYGGVTITKPITISGVGTQSSILASGTSGVIVNITAPVVAPNTNTVILRNLQINGAGATASVNGVRVLGATTVILDHVNIYGFGQNGVIAEDTSKVSISDGVFTNNTTAIHGFETSTITVENSQINGNNTAVLADLGSEVRLSNNGVYDNKTGFTCGTGGVIASVGNNRKAGNVGGVLPTCVPTVVITIQ
jgi:Right handed beta helix region